MYPPAQSQTVHRDVDPCLIGLGQLFVVITQCRVPSQVGDLWSTTQRREVTWKEFRRDGQCANSGVQPPPFLAKKACHSCRC